MSKRPFIILGLLFLLELVQVSLFAQNKSLSQYNSSENNVTASSSITLMPGFYVPYGSLFTASISSVPLATVAASSNLSYVITTDVLTSDVTDEAQLANMTISQIRQNIRYFDGLGRPLQDIGVNASPNAKDIVLPYVYNALGQATKKYLAYPASGENGKYQENAVNDQKTFYQNPSEGIVKIPEAEVPFSEIRFESSPLMRPIEQGAPGLSWQIGGGHTATMDYLLNETGEVNLWEINGNLASVTGTFAAGKLLKNVAKDENGNKTIQFLTTQGLLICKKVQSGITTFNNTYYLYNDFGQLSYVVPPAVSSASFTSTSEDFEKYIYAYKYDAQGNVIEKKVPGKAKEYMVYNELNQLVLSQDGNQRNKTIPEWTVAKYDEHSRTVMTGIYVSSDAISTIREHVKTAAFLWEERSEDQNGNGYTCRSFPLSLSKVLTVNYYDDYNFLNNTFGFPASGQSNSVSGLPTGSRTGILNSSEQLLSVVYYDKNGRIVKSKSQNHLSGTDEINNSYTFSGVLTTSTRKHSSSGLAELIIAQRFEYDDGGRRMSSYIKIGNQAEVEINRFVYNELGQVRQKKLHNGMENEEFSYTARGWLKKQTSTFFSMQLKYEDGLVPQYNGNVSEQLWGNGSSLSKSFAYTYDKLDRMLSGVANDGKKEELSYDLMGNILSLSRGTMGNLSYIYEGNKLGSISGYKNGTFSYDENGNTTFDGTKNLQINYNLFNLPDAVTKNTAQINYTYNTTGVKLQKQSATATLDYVGGINYHNGQIDYIQTEEGRIVKSGNTYVFEYTVLDYLGNIRANFDIYNGAPRLIQKQDYLPFGLAINKQLFGDENKVQFNGQEYQDELEQYDFNARFYDAELSRFTAIDPLADNAHDWTPYRFAFNNPLKYTDPNGTYETIEEWLDNVTSSDYGGTWSNGSSSLFTNSAEAFFKGVAYMNQNDLWGKNGAMANYESALSFAEDKGLVSKLMDGFSVIGYRQVGGGINGYAEKESFDNFWHGIQKDFNPDALDTRTLGHNLLWTSYAGGNNPKNYRGIDDFSFNPKNGVEQAAIWHDLQYEKLNIAGFTGLSMDKRAIKADWTYVGKNLAIAYNPLNNPIDRARAYLLGTGLGLIALPKTIGVFMPKMITPIVK